MGFFHYFVAAAAAVVNITLISAIEYTVCKEQRVLFALALLLVSLFAPPTRLAPSPLAACSLAFSTAGACRGRSVSSPVTTAGFVVETRGERYVVDHHNTSVGTQREGKNGRGKKKRSDDGHTTISAKTCLVQQSNGWVKKSELVHRNIHDAFALHSLLVWSLPRPVRYLDHNGGPW